MADELRIEGVGRRRAEFLRDEFGIESNLDLAQTDPATIFRAFDTKTKDE